MSKLGADGKPLPFEDVGELGFGIESAATGVFNQGGGASAALSGVFSPSQEPI